MIPEFKGLKIVIFGSTGQIGHALVKSLSTIEGNPFLISAINRPGSLNTFLPGVISIEERDFNRNSFKRLLADAYLADRNFRISFISRSF